MHVGLWHFSSAIPYKHHIWERTNDRVYMLPKLKRNPPKGTLVSVLAWSETRSRNHLGWMKHDDVTPPWNTCTNPTHDFWRLNGPIAEWYFTIHRVGPLINKQHIISIWEGLSNKDKWQYAPSLLSYVGGFYSCSPTFIEVYHHKFHIIFKVR